MADKFNPALVSSDGCSGNAAVLAFARGEGHDRRPLRQGPELRTRVVCMFGFRIWLADGRPLARSGEAAA